MGASEDWVPQNRMAHYLYILFPIKTTKNDHFKTQMNPRVPHFSLRALESSYCNLVPAAQRRLRCCCRSSAESGRAATMHLGWTCRCVWKLEKHTILKPFERKPNEHDTLNLIKYQFGVPCVQSCCLCRKWLTELGNPNLSALNFPVCSFRTFSPTTAVPLQGSSAVGLALGTAWLFSVSRHFEQRQLQFSF